jgi:hypothetical protein
MKNISSCLSLITTLLTLSACNLYGGLSSPSNDEQHLDAARACLDRNDYQCALDHYRALSDSYADIRINETSLTQLAQAQVFSFSDLITSLGTSLGNGRTLSSMAELIASRGAATASSRILIQQTYANNNSIEAGKPALNAKLRAFSRFISALAMYNTVLASAVGADGILTASDIVDDPALCAADSNPVTIPVSCVEPLTTAMPNSSVGGNPSDLDTATNWGSGASLKMLWDALSAADSEAAIFTGSQNGILSSINDLLLQAPSGAAEGLKRQQLVTILGLQ